jgi:FkbM family methyltransferase
MHKVRYIFENGLDDYINEIHSQIGMLRAGDGVSHDGAWSADRARDYLSDREPSRTPIILAPPSLLDHPAFQGLARQEYRTPAGFIHNGIGQKIAINFDRTWAPQITEAAHTDRIENHDLPWAWLHEEIFEWIALAESVRAAPEKFTMIELGAGYGRWLVAGAVLARRLRPGLPLKLVGVEAEPTHFAWMQQHFSDNDLNPAEHELIHAAVAAQSGTVQFVDSADPSLDYGQYVWDGVQADPARPPPRAAPAVGINDLLVRHDLIDLIDMDIQGYERAVVPAGIEEMNKRVKRVIIGIHEPIEIGTELTAVFKANGWKNLVSFPFKSRVETEYGPISFTDGVQYWLNPRLVE